MTIHGNRATKYRADMVYRSVGWVLLTGGLVSGMWNLSAARATPISWTLEQVALPLLVIGLAAFALRASSNERIEFDRMALTVRCSSQFRTRTDDLSGVKALFSRHPALRDWTRRYWQPEISRPTLWSDWTGVLADGDLRLLMTITQLFDDALLTWWLDETP